MDATSLRAELERALSAEPPLGNLVGRSLRSGRQLRRRRLAGAAALCGAAAAVAITAPALISATRKPAPATAGARPAVARTAYVTVGADSVVPVSLATYAVGKRMTAPLGTPIWGGVTTSAAATPDGRTVYEVGVTGDGDAAVTPIDTATKRAGRTIRLPGVDPEDIAIDPNGKTAYLSYQGGVVPITIATNAVGKRIRIPGDCWKMAFAPDGQTVYVLNRAPTLGPRSNPAPTVTPILTATSTALAPIRLPAAKGMPYDIAVTPDGRTAYVVDGVGSQPDANLVIPIDLVTDTALTPIRIKASGQAGGIVISPRGGTAYLLSSRAVTPINTATNKAGPAINLPESAGYANNIRLAPNGKTIYALTPRGVVPVRAASRRVLPMISIPNLIPFTDFEVTPDGRTVYVTTDTGVIPISTATNKAGDPINLDALLGLRPCRPGGGCVLTQSVIVFAR